MVLVRVSRLSQVFRHPTVELAQGLIRPGFVLVGFAAGLWAVLWPDEAMEPWVLAVAAVIGVIYGAFRRWAIPGQLAGLAGRTPVVVEEEDLFGFVGSIAVGVTQYFDTHHGAAVDRESTHGLLITRLYNNNFDRFRLEVDAALVSTGVASEGMRPSDGRQRYPIGTVAVLDRSDGSKVFLVAVASSDPDTLQAYSDVQKLTTALCSLWDAVDAHNSQKPIAVPLLGSGLARVAPEQTALELGLLTLRAASFKAPISKLVHFRVAPGKRRLIDFQLLQQMMMRRDRA